MVAGAEEGGAVPAVFGAEGRREATAEEDVEIGVGAKGMGPEGLFPLSGKGEGGRERRPFVPLYERAETGEAAREAEGAEVCAEQQVDGVGMEGNVPQQSADASLADRYALPSKTMVRPSQPVL